MNKPRTCGYCFESGHNRRTCPLLNKKTKKKYEANLETAIVMSEHTNWKWQWCKIKPASMQVMEKLSPEFACFEEAKAWLA
jgi:hypothetical protein|tara:strand:- start:56 stop:298 length:243 start_codon:yes stop_codon:yes gene_type:complete